MKASGSLVLSFFLYFLTFPVLNGQDHQSRRMTRIYSKDSRIYDSLKAARLPVLHMPEIYRNRSLPALVDNSQNEYWPGIRDQALYYSCQQYCGVAYVFGYEINRLRNKPGWYWENSYPTHYTWNFMNSGERYIGVDFLESFEVIRQQGHMTSDDYGIDTATSYKGWISGYDKYYRGMSNRLKQVYAIKVNSTEGINTLRNYLYDHLDGAATGGIACFTTSAGSLYSLPVLPAGTPEAGKEIILSWQTDPDHGLTVVGYNDSIRFDVNHDGRYTNDVDINGDGVVDTRDWEIGAFKIANSYGTWWSDVGYVYALYRSFAMNYENGGVWNNNVYVLDADTAYKPLLTVKVNMDYNLRDRIRILAGVSADTIHQLPENVISFPIFNFQGGENPMQGLDTVVNPASIELGLDVTPLLNFIPSGQPARFFLMVEENDPDHLGKGKIQEVTFINYQNGIREFQAGEENVPIRDNDITLVSIVATLTRPDVQITTTSLPPCFGSQSYQVQLAASGGRPPYSWSFVEDYNRQISAIPLPMITGSSLVGTNYKPFTSVALPFSFPFYGKKYDSIYVNKFGYITFEPQYLPGFYTTDELSMLKLIASIAPAFSQQYTYSSNTNDGIWFDGNATHAIVRWKATGSNTQVGSTDDFALILYPDGHFEFSYGTMDDQGFLTRCYSGVSKGDDQNCDLHIEWDVHGLSGKSFRYYPTMEPAGMTLSNEGLLKVNQADSSQIYDLHVKVADAGRISDSKILMLTGGLEISPQLICGNDDLLKSGQMARLKLTVTNTGLQPIQNLTLKIISVDSMLNISDSIFTIALLQPSQILTIPAAYAFMLKHPLPNGFPVMLTLQGQAGQRHWQKDAEFQVAAPDISILSPQVADGDNNLMDPGEIADLEVTLKNSGALDAHNLDLKLVPFDTAVKVLSSDSIRIDKLDVFTRIEFRFQIQVSRYTLPGHSAAMQILMVDSTGVLQVIDFQLPVSKKSVAIINLSSSDNSMLAMADALNSLLVDFDTIRKLPINFNFEKYKTIFLILGTSSQGEHDLTVNEAASFAKYLQMGGNLYMEGYFTWFYLNRTPLHPLFQYTSSKIPVYYYQNVHGLPQTFTDSMTYVYSGSPDYAIFSFVPKSPAYSTFVNNDSIPKNLQIVYDGSDYKTIGTFLNFGLLNGGVYPSDQQTLMQRYLEFFGLNITGPYPLFHAGITTGCSDSTITFSDDSFDNIISHSWEFSGGIPAISSDANPIVRYDSAGKFDVKLTVSDGKHTKSLLKKNYISINRCLGNEEITSIPLFRIFPNPATDKVSIEFSGKITGPCRFSLFDITGRKLLDWQSSISSGGNKITLNLGGFRRGLYFLRLQSGNTISTQKVILD